MNKSTTDWSQHEVRDLSKLHIAVVRDIALQTSTLLERDIQTINNRVSHEGISFLTKTLPAFGNAIFQAFQTGSFHGYPGFKKTKKSGCLPIFLFGLTSRLFSPETGEKVADDPLSAWGLRQICMFLYKYEFPHTEKQERDAICNMLTTDASLPDVQTLENELGSFEQSVLKLARSLLERLFFETDLKGITPRHGSGATEEGGIQQHEKFRFRNFSGILGVYYPQAEYTSPSLHRSLFNRDEGSPSCIGSAAEVARISAVPKDSRKPRIISAEPKERMWIQQGQMKALIDTIEHGLLTKGHVNFSDQTVNGALALLASAKGHLATLDMEAASDRVSLALALLVLPAWIIMPLLASRSTHTEATYNLGPDVLITIRQELRKFAPMGSAVCFPVESIIFWALGVATVIRSFDLEAKDVANQFYVYGDDIICPVEWTEVIMSTFEKFYLRFNREKSFSSGPFRESCGVDAFAGENITPIRLKKRRPNGKRDVSALTGWVDTSNLLFEAGLWQASDFMKSHVERILGYLPILRPPEAKMFGGLCWSSFATDIDSTLSGWHKANHSKSPAFGPSTIRNDGPDGFLILKSKWLRQTKVRGNKGQSSFVMLKERPCQPYYGGIVYKAITYVVKTTTYQPTIDEFPERSAMLRWFVTAAGNSERTFGASRTFAQRYKTTLRKRVMRLR